MPAQPPNPIPAEGFLTLKQIIGDSQKGQPGLIPIGRSSWLKGVSEGRFPKPVKLSLRRVAWPVAAIRRLISDLEAGRV